jgi:streptogramin lyase
MRAPRPTPIILTTLAILTSAGALTATATTQAATTEHYVTQITGTETPTKEFTGISALATAANDDIWAADRPNKVVDEMEPSGKYAGLQLAGAETPAKEFMGISALAVAANGDIWVSDGPDEVVDEMEPSGKYAGVQSTGTETPAKNFRPVGLAVAANGDIWVSDFANKVVDEMEPSGKYAGVQLTGAEAPIKEFKEFSPGHSAVAANGDVWVSDDANNVVDEFEPSGKYAGVQLAGTETPAKEFVRIAGIAVAANGDIWVADAGSRVVDEMEPSGKYVMQLTGAQIPAKKFSEVGSIALSATGDILVAEEKVIDEIELAPLAEAFTGDSSSLSLMGATVRGEVNPEGTEASGYFEYGLCPGSPCVPGVGGYTSKTEAVPVGKGTDNVKVEMPLSGLEPGRSYRYRLVAHNGNGVLPGTEGRFTLPEAPPPPGVSVATGGVSSVTQSTASVFGTVMPQGAEVTWGFEVGAEGGHTEAIAGGTLRAGANGIEPVTLDLSGLAPGVTYHYRVFATGEAGTVYGTEASFTTSLYKNPLSIPSAPPLVASPTIAFPGEVKSPKVVKKVRKKAKKKMKSRVKKKAKKANPRAKQKK